MGYTTKCLNFLPVHLISHLSDFRFYRGNGFYWQSRGVGSLGYNLTNAETRLFLVLTVILVAPTRTRKLFQTHHHGVGRHLFALLDDINHMQLGHRVVCWEAEPGFMTGLGFHLLNLEAHQKVHDTADRVMIRGFLTNTASLLGTHQELWCLDVDTLLFRDQRLLLVFDGMVLSKFPLGGWSNTESPRCQTGGLTRGSGIRPLVWVRKDEDVLHTPGGLMLKSKESNVAYYFLFSLPFQLSFRSR